MDDFHDHTAPIPPFRTLGADLRTLRKARDMTLSDLARRLQRSVGWLSQVERDLSKPSDKDLALIAAALDVSVAMLGASGSAPAEEAGIVVRHSARRPIDRKVDGLDEKLLSPDLTDAFEVVHSTFAPGSGLTEPVCRPTQEVGYLVAGRLKLTVRHKAFTIHTGDSFRIRGEPFMWENPFPEPAVAIWIIAPPVY